MDSAKVRERFERIEKYIDTVYDMAYGAIDVVFYGVDHVYGAVKKRALAHAERVSGPIQTPLDKAYALADYYENNGRPGAAATLRSHADKGLIDIKAVAEMWDGVQPPVNGR